MFEFFDPAAFAVGMIALINPCGFALLPAYLGYFLGLKEENVSVVRALNRSQLVGLSLSAGFVAVFGLMGIVFAGFYSSIASYVPWFTVVVAVGLVILGGAMIRGFQPVVKIPKLDKGTGSSSMVSMFVFGVSYAIASLSCTIGLFLLVVGTSASGRGFGDRLGSFVSYAIGMGMLATVLTLMVGLGKRGLVNRFRALLPKINFVSGLILIPVGVYVFLYGVWSIQVLNDPTSTTPWINSIVRAAEDFQGNLASSVDQRSVALGWGFLAINVAIVAAGLVDRTLRKSASTPATPNAA